MRLVVQLAQVLGGVGKVTNLEELHANLGQQHIYVIKFVGLLN